MAPPTNAELNEKREPQCISITLERKYYRCGTTWVKRSLRPTEWQKHAGYLYVPTLNVERVLNEGACLAFLAAQTALPLPKLRACFEDDGAAYLITDYVEGVGMNELSAADQAVVVRELEQHMATLRALTSNVWGGPDGQVLPPYRVLRKGDGRPWAMRLRETHDLVFCHNDLSAHNVIVDPATLQIRAIIDWEYAGFFPPAFERPFYQRLGPSIALPGEVDDADALAKMMDEERL